ncbi:MAG TPA: NADH-quinone oxidoreductase subunit L, partial [Thermoleophilia bacterium]|nr:NADH-quinone oxidoreductase subunit L [Thermoleophilia bacterium]
MGGTQSMKIAVALIPLLPLAGFLITLLLGKRYFRTKAHILPVALVTASAALSIYAFIWAFTHQDSVFVWNAFTWVAAGRFSVSWGFLVDDLTGVMLLVVGVIGMLVHYYSIGYMKDDEGYYRFFAYLNLFMFAMFILILADSYLLLFLGWEGVGLCSYLLISFWFRKKSASQAGKKAFLVNRVGDFGFTLGMFLIFMSTGTLQFVGVFSKVGMISSGTLLWICLLLFTGAVGKSAQFPLHVWLPDAMEGPTPVSALIHAATMVNAGVYMVARSYPLFVDSHVAMLVVMIIGTFTAIYAAYIAMTQNDIKKVIAYSTISSLGFMFMALGAG